jgi:Phosphogluconate dehydrogenase (decarboxylating) C-term
LFGYSDAHLSDGAKLAVERARDRIFRSDWRSVFDIENVIREVKAITQGMSANKL